MSTGKKRLLVYVVMLISVVVSVRLVKDIIRIWNSDERILQAEEELLTVKQEQVELESKLSSLESDDWWEAQVRNNLKMARENEKIVIIPEKVRQVKEMGVEQEFEEEELSNLEKWQKVFF